MMTAQHPSVSHSTAPLRPRSRTHTDFEPYRPKPDPGAVGVAFLDMRLRVQSINPYLARCAGRPVDALLDHDMAQAMPSLSPMLDIAVIRVLETGAPAVDVETRLHPADGTPDHLLLTTLVRVDGPLGPLGISVVTREATR